MPNSAVVLAALKLKMDMTYSKPAQKLEAGGKVQIEIVSLAPSGPTVVPSVPLPEATDAVEEQSAG